VDTSLEEDQIDVAEALRELKSLEARRREIEAQMDRYLDELGYN